MYDTILRTLRIVVYHRIPEYATVYYSTRGYAIAHGHSQGLKNGHVSYNAHMVMSRGEIPEKRRYVKDVEPEQFLKFVLKVQKPKRSIIEILKRLLSRR